MKAVVLVLVLLAVVVAAQDPVAANASLVPNPCKLPIVKGPCRGRLPRFGFNATAGRCYPFLYSGCQGNANNFATLDSCEKHCPLVCPRPKTPLRCIKPPCSVSRCPAYPEARCFNDYCYGCRALWLLPDGRQLSDKQCNRITLPPVGSKCHLPIVPGPCRGSFRRYAYNRQLKQCVPFIYGGCGGNANNFDSLASCQAHCPTQCTPPEVHCLMVPCLPNRCGSDQICIANVCSGCGHICLRADGKPVLPPLPVEPIGNLTAADEQ